MAEITRHPREKIDVVWSSSFVCNLFRIYELIFWRRAGIRCEGIAYDNGEMYSYTWENLLVTYEWILLSWLKGAVPKFEIIWLPQMQLAGMRQGGIQPFAFAIAFDAANAPAQNSTSPVLWNATVTGTNPALVVGYHVGGTTTDFSTACTYNSVAGSKVTGTNVASRWGSAIWYMGNASTGTNQVSLTMSSGNAARSSAASYSGCAANANVGGAIQQDSVTSITLTITSTVDKCWLVGEAIQDGVALTAGSGTTFRGNSGDSFAIFVDGNAAITPAGSSSIVCTCAGGSNAAFFGTTIAPGASAATVKPKLTLLLMGV